MLHAGRRVLLRRQRTDEGKRPTSPPPGSAISLADSLELHHQHRRAHGRFDEPKSQSAGDVDQVLERARPTNLAQDLDRLGGARNRQAHDHPITHGEQARGRDKEPARANVLHQPRPESRTASELNGNVEVDSLRPGRSLVCAGLGGGQDLSPNTVVASGRSEVRPVCTHTNTTQPCDQIQGVIQLLRSSESDRTVAAKCAPSPSARRCRST